jgi:(2Fe-2S) ferredoxin/2-polyprenyl-3-methyl-5-hydroxy-6-metoxy-1,4-benzoquinol methylase
MQVYPIHVFVCDQQKPEGVPCCAAHGSAAVIDALRAQVGLQGLGDTVQVTVCGSLGLCERGPNMVVYPEGVWYSGVQPRDVAEIVDSHFRKGQVVERLVNHDAGALRSEITTNRTRMLNALREKDASGALPDPLMQTVRGFQESRVILTAIELDIFTALGSGGTAAHVAGKIGADPRATEMLLNALTAMGLLTKREDSFENTQVSMRYLAAGSKDDNRLALKHLAHLWGTWSTLTDSVRAGTAVGHEEIPDRSQDWTEAFIAAMHRNATERAGEMVRAVNAEKVRRLLDVGGGSGAYSIAFARMNPELQAEVFDLPSVTPIADRHIHAARLDERIRTRSGNFLSDNFGNGFDLALVSAICHMLTPEDNVNLCRRCFLALTHGGRIVIRDFVLNASKTAPKAGALFALNMLVGTRAGSSYSEPEYTHWLEAAGFSGIHKVQLPGPTQLMIGVKA